MENVSTPQADVPPLVDSDVEIWTEFLGDYISVWLHNSPQFIQDQKQLLLRMALCPFLFGVMYNVPRAWHEVLHTYGVIEKDRENKTTPLSETELEMLEMAETIFVRCSQLVENKNDLKTILNFIYDIEDRSALTERIDISYALQEVVSLEVFSSMWAPIKRIYDKKKKQAQVCIIYYFKIVSDHIILYGRDGVSKAEYVSKMLSDFNRAENEESVSLMQANKSFKDKNYKLAIKQYSTIIEKEPLNTTLYHKRAQAYICVSDFRGALCDSKRAILLEPQNYKHYLRAAKSYLELGQLDKAEETCLQSLEICKEPSERENIALTLQNIKEIEGTDRMTKVSQNDISSGSEEREIDTSQNAQVQYRRLIQEGFNLYLSTLYSRAVDQFKSALNIIARPDNEGVTVVEQDRLIVWFAYGMSCVKTANIQNIQVAIEKFSAIISRSDEFPAAHYGLALAYMALKRYKDAEDALKVGLVKISKCESNKVYQWPQTDKTIEETDIPTLKKLMEDLLKECWYPPKPDAVCKFHEGSDGSKREIYISDPDYKGHICIKCRADCFIEFHAQCWKASGDNYPMTKHNWKEILDTACPTPGCWGLISEVFICRPDQEKSKKLRSQLELKAKPQQPRPKLKIKTDNVSKLERKLERKRLRKEKRLEAHSANVDMEDAEDSQNTPANVFQPHTDEELANIHIDRTGTMLVKDDPEILVEKKQKVGKSKKKEKKQKQFLTLDVQFKGDENKERYSVYSLDEEGDVVDKPTTIVNPGLLPTPGSGVSSLPNRPQKVHPPNMDRVDASLYSLFYDILTKEGPMHLFGKELEDHIKYLSEEAQNRIHFWGGLGTFLSSNPKFSISANHMVSAISLGPQQKATLVNQWEIKPKLEASSNLSNIQNVNPPNMDRVDASLYNLFYDILTTEGPMNLFGKELEDHIKYLSEEAQNRIHFLGGLGIFLSSNPKFSISANHMVSAVSLGPQQKATLGNQPEIKPKKLEASSNLSNIQNLNPAAKEFIPQETALASGLSDKRTAAQDGLKESLVSKAASALDDFQAPADDSDEGFTTVISKKRLHAHGFQLATSSSDASKFNVARPPSLNNSFDESIKRESPITISSTINEMVNNFKKVKEKSEKASGNVVPSIKINNSGSLWKYPMEKLLGGSTVGVVPLAPASSVLTSNTGRGSDASDVSIEDNQRVSSPALSTNSGSSSGRTDGSRTSSQVSVQPPALRPLKAPGIVLPSRGKKRPIGHHSSKLYSHHHPLSTDASLLNDGYEEDSVSSTTSDKDNSWGDHKTLAADKFLHDPVIMPSDQSSTASTTGKYSIPAYSKRDFLSRKSDETFMFAHHQFGTFDVENLHSEYPSESTKASVYANKTTPIHQRLNTNLQEDAFSKNLHDQLSADFGFQKDSKFSAAYITSDKAKNISMPAGIAALHSADDQLQSRVLDQVTARSDRKATFEKNAPSDSLWSSYSYFSMPKSSATEHTDMNEVIIPPSDPWLNQDKRTFSNAEDDDDDMVIRKGKLDVDPLHPQTEKGFNESAFLQHDPVLYPRTKINSQESIYRQPKHSHKNIFQQVPLPKDFVGAEKVKSKNPWLPEATTTQLKEGQSSQFLTRGHDNQGSRFSVFDSWTDYTSSGSSELTTSSIDTQQNKTDEQVSAGVGSLPQLIEKDNPGDKGGSRLSGASGANSPLPQIFQGSDAFRVDAFRSRAAEHKTAEVQTCLKGVEIQEMSARLKILKESNAAKEVALQEKLKLQDALKDCEKQLSREKLISEKLKQDVKKRAARIQVAETTAEIWKENAEQLTKENQQLKVQNQTQTDAINELHQQLETEKLKFFHSQVEIIELKKLASLDRIDVKKRDATVHLKRLAGVITQAGATAAKNLPPAVFEKCKEFSAYIHSCESLKSQIEETSQRLATDLAKDMSIDMSSLNISLPAFPKAPSEALDRPQVSVISEPQTKARNGTSPASSVSSESQDKVPVTAVHSDKTQDDDDDSQAYLSMFYNNVKGSDSSSNQKDGTASAIRVASRVVLNDDDDGDQMKRNGIFGAAASDVKRGQVNLPARAASASSLVPPFLAASSASNISSPKVSRTQPETSESISASTLWPHTQSSRVLPSLNLPQKGQQKTAQQKPYFERIVELVDESCPGYSRGEIQRLVDKLRRSNGGTLSNWTFEELANRILDMILDQGEDEIDSVPDEHLLNSGSKINADDFQCSICQHEIEPLEALSLSCGHTFHESCAHRWLQSNRICPNCRSHALLPQDFPSLK